MDFKKGLEDFNLELIFYNEEVQQFREVLAETQKSHVLACTEQEIEYKGKENQTNKAVIFRIFCPTTSFALGYYMLGCMVQKEIISKRNY
jgi:hypothetical protein